MNVRKRGLALLLCVCMIFTLLPFSALAADSDVVYGKYNENGEWQQVTGATDEVTYTTSGDNKLTLSKKATKTGENTYQIDLKVVSTQTTSTTPPGSAAAVLVIDVSGSMGYCAECGSSNRHSESCQYSGKITGAQSRLTAAKNAAVSFLDSYKGDTEGTGRYVSLVSFSSRATVAKDWVDVSVSANYNDVVEAINRLSADGGTNLEQGLTYAKNQLDKDTVKAVVAKNVIALTDGEPTYYGTRPYGDGSSCDKNTYQQTKTAATNLKNTGAALYTVCFGVANDTITDYDNASSSYYGGSSYGKITVGDYLASKIATPAADGKTYAYNADNTAELMEAFRAITSTIIEGLNTGLVTDPMGENVTVTNRPDNFVNSDGNTYTWELSGAEGKEVDGKTVYTYTLSYTITLDTTGENFNEDEYHAANGVTTFTSGNDTYYFNVPGVKGIAPRYNYTIKYMWGDTEIATAKTGKDKAGTEITESPESVNGYTPVSNDAKTLTISATGENVLVFNYYKNVELVANSGTFTYDGTEKTIAGYKVCADSKEVDVTFDGVSASGKGTNAGTYPVNFADDYVSKVADDLYIVTKTTPGKLTIDKADTVTVTITGNTDSVVYDGTEKSVSGYTTDVGEKTISVALKDGVKAEAKGTNVGTYEMGLTKDSFDVTSDNYSNIKVVVVDGYIEITPITDEVTVTITGNNDSVVYDGTEKSVSGYTTDVGEKTISVALKDGVKAEAKGTNVGTYEMGLTKDSFDVTSDNYSNIKVVVVDGYLEITPITDEVTVTITGNNDSVVYDGTEKSVSGYTTDVGEKTISVALKDGVKAEAKGTNVGTYEMGLTKDSFDVTSDNYSNIKVVVVDGYLEITPITDEVTVTITGNNDSVVYDGTEKSVSGYTTDVGEKTISVALKDGVKAEAKGTNVGTYEMGLTKDSFDVTSDNYSNIKVVVVDGYLEITPITDEVTVTITGNTDSVVYDGTEKSVSGYTTDVGEKTISVALKDGVKAEAKGTNVGTYEMGLTKDSFDVTSDNYSNIKVVVVDGYLEITPITDEVTVTITGNTDSVVYDGTEKSVSGYTTDVGEKTISVALKDGVKAEAKGTNVGTYEMGLTKDSFDVTSDNYSNIKVVVVDGYLEITPITDEVTVTITGNNDSVVYDGTEKSVSGYTTDVGEKTISVALKDGVKAEAKGTNVGTYEMGLTKDSFDVTSDNYSNIKVVVVDGYLEITPITDEVTVTITGNNDSVVYDGTEKSVSGYTTDVGEKTISVALKDGVKAEAKGTNVGTYEMGLTKDSFDVTSDNYSNIKVVVVDGYLEITPITDEVTVTITGNTDSVVYDGTEKSVSGYTTDVGEKTISVALKDGVKAEAKGTNVGTYEMGLTKDSFDVTSDNYSNIKVVVVDGYIEITPITDEVVVTITGHKDTAKYDGKDHSVSGYDVAISNDLYTVSDFTYNGTASVSGTNADTYKMGLDAAKFENISKNFTNVRFVVTDGSLTITKRDVTLTSGSAEKEYDGTALTNSEVTVSGDGFADGEGASYNVTGSQTEVGKSDNTFTYTLNEGTLADNYNITTVAGTLEVTKIQAEVTVTINGETKTVYYNGKEQSVTGHTWTSDAEFASKISVTPKEEGVDTASGTKPDTYYMGLTAEDFNVTSDVYANIKVVVNDGWLKINRRPVGPTPEKITVTITGNTDSKVYDGTEQNVNGYTWVSSDPSYTAADFEFSGKADANGTYVGSYDMGITADQFKNINSRYTVEFIVETDGELKITPKPLTITAGSKEGVAPVTCDEWTATETAKGDTIVSVTITGIQPVPGESPNKASNAVIKNEAGVDVTSNYDITYVDGVLRAIEVLNKEEHFNYVIGYTDGTIRPGNNISRAEIATIFFRLLKDDVREKYMTTDCSFSDVASGAWCRRAIATLTNIGIIHGYTDGTFRPNAQITRAELATIIARFANLDVNTKTFNDITGHWAQKSIELAAGNGWINGYTDGTFRPNNKITRAETFAMINRVLDRTTKSVDDLLPQSDMNMWKDNMDESAWYYSDVQEATNYHKCDRVGDSIYEKWTAKIADIDWAVYQI